MINIATSGQGLYEFTDPVEGFFGVSAAREGLMTMFGRHAARSLVIQENADPSVQCDLKTFFTRLVPPSDDASMHWITHRDGGRNDMPAHIKATLAQVFIGIPFSQGCLLLGT